MKAQSQFNLQSNKIFSPDEKANVFINAYSYYNRDRNVNELNEFQFSLYEITDVQSFIDEAPSLQNEAYPEAELQKLRPLRSWNSSFSNRSYNNSIDLGKLPEGIYILEAMSNGKSANVPIIVSTYSMIIKQQGDEAAAYVADASNGKVQKNWTFRFPKDQKTLISTDNNSVIYLSSADQIGGNYLLTATNGKHFVISQAYFNQYYRRQNLLLYTFTDRSAYKAGQTVFFKCYAREKNSNAIRILTDSIVYKISDEQGNEIAKKTLALSETGSFDHSIQLAENAALGTYYIDVYPTSTNEQERNPWYFNNQQRCSFLVEAYKKPEYEVLVNFDKAQYVSGDEMKINIEAEYFFGGGVADGEVSWQLLREEIYTPWYYRSPWAWCYGDYYPYRANKEIEQSGEGKLDKNGQLLIKLPSKADANRNYRYSLTAEVRDQSRRSVYGAATASVANTEFSLSAVSKKYYYKPNENLEIIIAANDFNSQPVETDILIKFFKYENNFQSGRNKKLLFSDKKMTQKETGEYVFSYKIPEVGIYELEVEATDNRGKKVTASTSAYVYDVQNTSYRWWETESGNTQIYTDKKVYNTGEKLSAIVYVPHNTDVLLTIGNRGIKHYKMQSVHATNNIGQGGMFAYEIPIDETMEGKMNIAIVYIYENTLYYKQEDFTIIPQQQFLDVSLTFKENEYRPATEATAILKVTDSNGKPVPNAEVTLSTVDEALFALYPDNTPDIRQFFYKTDNHYYSNVAANQFNSYNQSRVALPASLLRYLRNNQGNIERRMFLDDDQWIRWGGANISSVKKNEYWMVGFVVDNQSGKPIADAEVTYGGKSTRSDKDGRYELHLENFNAVSNFKASYQGHSAEISDFDIKNTNTTILNIAIDAKKNLSEKGENINTLYIVEDEVVSMDAVAVGAAPMAEMSAGGRMSKSLKMNMNEDKAAEAMPNPQIPVVRSNFKDAIYWNPYLRTNEKGEATLRITLPDNLTTWRSTARVVTRDTKVGEYAAKIIVNKPLLVRMETPRFFLLNDEMYIATTVHNNLTKAQNVKVTLVANGLSVSGTEKTIAVPAHGVEKVDWNIKADMLSPQAELTVQALAEESDAMQLKVPVNPYGLEMNEGEYVYALNSQEKDLHIFIPENVDARSVKLQISTVPSVSAALLNSMDQLIGYPYGCVEQTMSRFLPLAVVGNTLEGLGTAYKSPVSFSELQKMTDHGVKRLQQLQHNDGGFGWWENDETHPFMTAYVCYGLHIAREAGLKIDDKMYEKVKTSLANQLESKAAKDNTTLAYQLMVANMCRINNSWKNLDHNLPKDANAYEVALLLQAALYANDQATASKMLQWLEKNAINEGNFTYWGGKKFYYNWQDDSVETTAQVVRAIAMMQADNALLPKATLWLMSKRKGNAWHNTRQTAMVIFGLQDIIRNEVNPDVSYDLEVNGETIDNSKFSAESVFATTPAKTLFMQQKDAALHSFPPENAKYAVLQKGDNHIRIRQNGRGATYTTTRLSYFVSPENIPAPDKENNVFEVSRTYYKLNLEKRNGQFIYTKQKLDAQDIHSGDDILVKVKIKNPSEREYVLVEDPIPAGCEFIRDESSFVIEGEENFSDNRNKNGRINPYYWNNWYTHKEFRDDRYALTITQLGAGEYEYAYLLKAQIPGKYHVNPSIVQLMYYPEVRGWSAFSSFEIKE
ncbi:MAG: alpha-2-macroglobulin family protein [Chitinophagales bacterium]|nr:hypothetical protein [Bacteroidota bacterium]